MLGGPFNAAGSLIQGRATAASLQAQADNLEQEAQQELAKGEYDAQRQQMISGQKIGTSIASYAASGVTNTGSVLDVLAASQKNAELDRLNILHGADIRAINYANQAAMNRAGAQAAIRGSYWAAAGAITGGALSMVGGGDNKMKKDSYGEEEGTDSGFGGEAGTEAGSGEAAGAAAGEGEVSAAALA